MSLSVLPTPSNRLKNWLFYRPDDPVGDGYRHALFLKEMSIGRAYLLDQKQLTLAALCVACVAAILTGWWLTKERRCMPSVSLADWWIPLAGGDPAADAGHAGRGFVVAITGNSVQKVVSLFEPGQPLYAGGDLLPSAWRCSP